MPPAPDDPRFTIAFALSRQRRRLRRIPDNDGVEFLMPVADAVLAQLAMSGWELRHQPRNGAWHSTHGTPGGDGRRWHDDESDET